MVCSGDNVRSSVFVGFVVVIMSDLVRVFVCCVLVTMSDLMCLCGV